MNDEQHEPSSFDPREEHTNNDITPRRSLRPREGQARRAYNNNNTEEGNSRGRKRFIAQSADQPILRRRTRISTEEYFASQPNDREYNSKPLGGERSQRSFHREQQHRPDTRWRDDYPQHSNTHYDDSRSDSQQREFYKERYQQTLENARQQYGERPQRPRTAARTQGAPYGNNNNRNRGGRSYNNNNNGGYGAQPRKGGENKNTFTKKRFEPKPTPITYEATVGEDELVRLNKYLANSGRCSRREADNLISQGQVTVNGEVVTELGTKVTRKDEILLNGEPVSLERKVYILLNKPRNCVTTSDDPQERLTVLDLVKNACEERVYPIGRLDRNTTGVLLLTNDGDLASTLLQPKFQKKKIYEVKLDRDVAVEDMQRIADGIDLEDGEMHADAISYVSEDDFTTVGIEIHSGRNRIVRRIFEHLGYKVVKLDRVYFAGLTKKNVSRGKWRYLTPEEVSKLRQGAFE